MSVDVKARLTLEDDTSGTLGKLRQGFEAVTGASEKTEASSGFLSNTLSTMAGVYLPQLITQAKDFAASLLDAARSGDAADQALAGFMSVVQGKAFGEARAEAEAFGDEIDAIAIKIGQPIGEVGDAFQRLIELTGATEAGMQKSKADLEGLARIANVMGMNTVTLAQEWGFMQEGMVRTKGKLFQLLQTTGIFGEKTKEASAGWAKLTEEQRMQAMSEGLAKVNKQLLAAAPTFDDLVNTIMNVKEVALEKFGEPIMHALKPELQRFAETLQRNTHLIGKFAEMVADDARAWVVEATKYIERGFKWLTLHYDDIKKSIVEGFEYAKEVVGFILKHKEEIALAFGAKVAAPKIQGMVADAKMAYGAGKSIYDAGAAGTGAIGLSGAAGGVAALGAFAAAIIGVSLAADQATKALKEGAFTSKESSDAQARKEMFERMITEEQDFAAWGQKQTEAFEHIKREFVASADAIGMTQAEAGKLAEKAWEMHRAARAQVEPFDQTLTMLQKMEDAVRASQAAGGEGMSPEELEARGNMINAMSGMMQNAIATQNDGAIRYMASTLGRSKEIRDVFLNSALLTEEGFNSLASVVETMGPEFADFAKGLRGRAGGEASLSKAMEKPRSVVNFNGGQTFKINQEFRDADPDRIAMVFRRDLISAAERRVQSNYASPFGT